MCRAAQRFARAAQEPDVAGTQFSESVLTIIRIRVHTISMIICVCKAVSDRHIRAAVADGATCMRELTRGLGVGTSCGKCLPEAKAALAACMDLAEARAQRNPGGDSTGLFPSSIAGFAT
jgi:bacterioferritin-associated ferredoxin